MGSKMFSLHVCYLSKFAKSRLIYSEAFFKQISELYCLVWDIFDCFKKCLVSNLSKFAECDANKRINLSSVTWVLVSDISCCQNKTLNTFIDFILWEVSKYLTILDWKFSSQVCSVSCFHHLQFPVWQSYLSSLSPAQKTFTSLLREDEVGGDWNPTPGDGVTRG